MVRPKKCRVIKFDPKIKMLMPKPKDNGEIALDKDEVEALRLIDYCNYNQREASKLMGISQPTLNRILKSARKKVAKAIVEGLRIKLE